MLGRADPVGVDRLHVIRVRLAAPAQEEPLGCGIALRDDVVGRRLPSVADGRGPRDDLHHLRGDAREVGPGLVVRDLVQLAEAPVAREAGRLGLEVGRRVAGDRGRFVGLRLRHLRVQVVVDQQAPHVLVGVLADQLFDVDAAIAELPTLAIRLGNLRLDGDD
ncbi:MAG: hypothetical protein K0S82_2430, partial [Gaiellaceae bacterium]|nr:hypothetical protein [Gaiellaceae bacterium]